MSIVVVLMLVWLAVQRFKPGFLLGVREGILVQKFLPFLSVLLLCQSERATTICVLTDLLSK